MHLRRHRITDAIVVAMNCCCCCRDIVRMDFVGLLVAVDMDMAWQIVDCHHHHCHHRRRHSLHFRRMERIRLECIQPFRLMAFDWMSMDPFDPVMTVVYSMKTMNQTVMVAAIVTVGFRQTVVLVLVSVSVIVGLHRMAVLVAFAVAVHHLVVNFEYLSWSFDLNNNCREIGLKVNFEEHFGELPKVSRLGLEENRWANWK